MLEYLRRKFSREPKMNEGLALPAEPSVEDYIAYLKQGVFPKLSEKYQDFSPVVYVEAARRTVVIRWGVQNDSEDSKSKGLILQKLSPSVTQIKVTVGGVGKRLKTWKSINFLKENLNQL